MQLIDIYSAMQKAAITTEEAAEALGITPKDMKFRLTRWGAKLPLLLSVLDKIKANRMSRGEAAETLGISVRQVNHLMNTWKVHRPIPRHVVDHAIAEVKWEIRKKYAIEYIAGSCTIEEAAENAEVSTRQIRRWVSNLLSKHYAMVFKELAPLPFNRRKRLADEIERLEGLEYTKRQALQSIRRGEKTIEEEAASRIADIEKWRKRV